MQAKYDPRMVDLQSATVVRSELDVVFRNLTWTINEGETWAIVGSLGSGKTSLAETLLGRLRVTAGTITWPFLDRLRATGRTINWPSDVIRYVSFKEQSHLFSYGRHYYQQRFNFIEPQDDLSLNAFLRSDKSASDEAILGATKQLGIDGLLHLSLIKLSNGQIRRARIARALLSQPEWLILDEPFMGLDAAGRGEVAELLGTLVDQGTRLLLIVHPEEIPGWVTHIVELERQAICWQGRRTEYRQNDLPVTTRSLPPPNLASLTADPIIEMHDVNVQYDAKPVLQDISWTVRTGERWALLGPNGSGKTTLLSLICGDHPQAYSNDIRLFGKQRGTGESIWDIKRRIGLLFPELHLYYSEPLSAFRTAATGFFDVLAFRPTTREQDARIHELFSYFEIAALADRPFLRLSTGEQRLVLLIRALVKSPELLILDEPFQGLDYQSIRRAQHWLDHRLRPDQTLIFVSHVPEEIPKSVTHQLRLEAGRVVESKLPPLK
jgi:molybdate transport system ATP-binding protein